jgi:Domain of unknown function (DUF6504)
MLCGQDAVVQVWTGRDGCPDRLVWQGRRWRVATKPVPWIDRKSWWAQAGRAPAGVGKQLLEQPMWRFRATAEDNGQTLTFDLAQRFEPAAWHVVQVCE